MTEMQGKSILVRVSARFELARVRVIESQLYRGCAFSTTVMENRPIVYDKIAEDVATFKANLKTFLLRKYFR